MSTLDSVNLDDSFASINLQISEEDMATFLGSTCEYVQLEWMKIESSYSLVICIFSILNVLHYIEY